MGALPQYNYTHTHHLPSPLQKFCACTHPAWKAEGERKGPMSRHTKFSGQIWVTCLKNNPEIVWPYKTQVQRLVTLGFPRHLVLSNAPRNHMLLNGVSQQAITQCPGKQHSVSLWNTDTHKSEAKVNILSFHLICILFSVFVLFLFCFFERRIHYEGQAGFQCEAPAHLSPTSSRIRSRCHHALLKVKTWKCNY